jgi:hypothetical protein
MMLSQGKDKLRAGHTARNRPLSVKIGANLLSIPEAKGITLRQAQGERIVFSGVKARRKL